MRVGVWGGGCMHGQSPTSKTSMIPLHRAGGRASQLRHQLGWAGEEWLLAGTLGLASHAASDASLLAPVESVLRANRWPPQTFPSLP